MVPIRLKRLNYLPWRALFGPILRRYKLLRIIDGTKACPSPFLPDRSINPTFEEWYEKDQNLLIWFNSTLSEEIIPFTVRVSSSHELWLKLEQRFCGISEAHIHQLRSRLQSVQKGSRSISEYLQEIKEISDSLQAAGAFVSDRNLIAAILHGLPDDIESFIDSIMLRLSFTSLDELHGLLLTKELSMARRKTISSSSAAEPFQAFSYQLPSWHQPKSANRGKNNRGHSFSHRGNRSFQTNLGNYSNIRGNRNYQGPRHAQGSSNFKVPCQICGSTSHEALDCFDRMNPDICGRIPSVKLAAMYVNQSAKPSQSWLIDSGATSHVTNDVANISSPTPYTGEDKVYIGDALHTPHTSFKLQNVLHVPYMKHNFLSAYQFLKDNNCSLTLNPYGSTVKDYISRKMLLRGPVRDGLYSLQGSSNSSLLSPLALLSVKASVKVISTNKLALKGKSIIDFFCSNCALAKNHKLHFGVSSSTTSHTSVISNSGFKYYLLIVDDFSKYSWFFPSKSKSDLLQPPCFCPNTSSPASSSSLNLYFDKYIPHLSTSSATSIPNASASASDSPHPFSSQPISVLPTSSSEFVSKSSTLPLSQSNHPPIPINSHPMITRSKAGIYKSKPQAYAATKHLLPVDIDYVLSKYLQASKHAHWRAAMQDEYNALISTGTWSIVPSHPSQNVVGCKWVFRVKKKADGTIDTYKARLVAKGFHQQEAIDFQESFSPVAKPVTIRNLLTLVVQYNWFLNQLDINNVFLHGDLKEDVYMQQPPEFVDPNSPNSVYKLKKSLYRLKQAPRAWFDKLFQALHSLGFQQSSSNASLFVLNGPHLVIVLVYVDDILVTGPNSQLCQQFITQFSSQFPIKDLDPLHYFLGLEVHRSSQGIFVHQSKYLLDLLKKTNMEGAKPCCTPLSSKKLDNSGPLLSNPTEYRSIVGGLQYLTWTRPDLAFVATKRVLRFLKGSLSHGLWLTKCPIHLSAYSDADWAGCTFDRRSTSGYCVAKKQSTVVGSSTEAEYRSLAHTAAELTWVYKILRDLHFPIPTLPTLWCDNILAISLASNPVFHARTKHVEIDYHYIRELVLANLLKVQYVCSEDQLADLHTKSLSKSRFQFLCSKLPIGICSDSPSSLRGCIRENDKSPISVTVK
ncbi:hypothetical protein D8674_017735 [Pyrus ussuriensis x Pyrus communis]|uniref:Reverse transcriptase Ty1/copia-type domain-containing protein n=1 Tax=Pyrus ussuriensis x Pyrus communis TaxID=2448454 RepID=A0A5N5HDY0_9ROSA|nr:hypothetical protein D8674_017735 [Pyrus ussuriensis x Pyrus communis]